MFKTELDRLVGDMNTLCTNLKLMFALLNIDIGWLVMKNTNFIHCFRIVEFKDWVNIYQLVENDHMRPGINGGVYKFVLSAVETRNQWVCIQMCSKCYWVKKQTEPFHIHPSLVFEHTNWNTFCDVQFVYWKK